jgi:predicted DsbA family dithiol-disulfide isomerase
MAAFTAYFADGQNLAERQVLLDLARNVGLPVDEAEKILDHRAYSAKVDQDWADSRLKGITAVPTFIIGTHKLVGAQDYDTLTEMLHLYGVAMKQR